MLILKRAQYNIVDSKINKKTMVKFVDFLVNKNGFCLFENYPCIQTPYNYVKKKALSLEILLDTFNVVRKYLERILQPLEVKSSQKNV